MVQWKLNRKMSNLIKASVAKICITPPIGVDLSGYAGRLKSSAFLATRIPNGISLAPNTAKVIENSTIKLIKQLI